MLVANRTIACGFLLLAPCVYGQDTRLERPASDFNSKGVGLTETLLKFSHQQHLRIAIEYVDRASMDKPLELRLENKTVRQALDSILLNGCGYSWRLRNRWEYYGNCHPRRSILIQLSTYGDTRGRHRNRVCSLDRGQWRQHLHDSCRIE